MKNEIIKILVTSLVSAAIAVLQTYLLHLGTSTGADSTTALASVNGFVLALSHTINKRV